MRINSGRFTSSEIHECPARSSFPTTLGNVMHNIEFQPVCEFRPAFALQHNIRKEPKQPRALNTKELSPRGTVIFKENTLSILHSDGEAGACKH